MKKLPLELKPDIIEHHREAMINWSIQTQALKEKSRSNMIMVLGGVLLGSYLYMQDTIPYYVALFGVALILVGMYFYASSANKAKFAFKSYALREAWLNNKAQLIINPSTGKVKVKGENHFFDIADHDNWS
ncbi:MAG: hypothetical protein EBT20_20035 [Alphaproteobacteria bacterium]|nr:hypothetical protein [Alphaproteobacteria bacterium]